MKFLDNIFAPPNIEQLKKEHDIAGLSKALAHRNPQVRRDAVRAFSDLADYLSFSPVEGVIEPVEWPMLPPSMGKDWLKQGSTGIDEGEVILGVIGVELPVEWYFEGPYNRANRPLVYKLIDGRRNQALISCVKQGDSRQYGLPKPVGAMPNSYLFITSHYAVVRAFISGPMWKQPLHEIQRVRLEENKSTMNPHHCLILDFGDNDPITFTKQPLGTAWLKSFRRDMLLWTEQCNRYLELLHSNDKASLESYIDYRRAIARGADVAVTALTKALDKERDAEIKRDITDVLARIRRQNSVA